MEPITLITTALVVGITAGLKSVTTQAIKDAYSGLRTLIVDKYKISLSALESKPESSVQVAAIAEQLKDAKAEEDGEVTKAAEDVIKSAEKQEETQQLLGKIQITLKNNKQFAFSVSGSAVYNEGQSKS